MNESNWAHQWARRSNEAAMGSKAGAMRQTMRRTMIGVGAVLALALGATGCHKTAQQVSNTAVDQNGVDPADANMASGNSSATAAGQQPAQVLGERAQNQNQQQSEDYSQQGAPIIRQAPDAGQATISQSETNAGANNDAGDQLSQQQAEALYAADLTDAEANDPPPPLPDYEQPPAPDPDYLWTPGYWAWSSAGYYWVPGNWVAAPYAGALWTPGYWGFFGGHYRFHHGYWGLHIGYYGGVDYGYGYVGHGYYGGYWNHDHFFYNTTITHVNVEVIRNVYVHPVVVNNVIITGRIGNRVSFNGGRGGIVARPLPAEVRVLHENRIPPMATQVQVQHTAAQNREQFFNQNGGRPVIAAAARPIAADRVLPAALPRSTIPVGQRPLYGNPEPAQIQTRPVQPQSQTRPAQSPSQMRQMQTQPQSQARPDQPQSQTRPGQPQPQQWQTQQQTHQPQPQPRFVQPQTQTLPAERTTQPSVQPHTAPITPPSQPQFRPEPQTQTRPQATPPEPMAAPRSQSQTAPVVHSQPQTAPSRPTPTAHPQPQTKSKEEEKH